MDEESGKKVSTMQTSKSQLGIFTPLNVMDNTQQTESQKNLADFKQNGDQESTGCKKKYSSKQGFNKTIAVGILDRQRQLSQAQRQNRSSLNGNKSKLQKITYNTNAVTSEQQQGIVTRTVATTNKPEIQLPAQILQSKIIIHLLKTDYPLIEQVAKNEMGWRVSKSENPNAEFDIYWHDIAVDVEKMQSLKPYQKVNHFPGMFGITNKKYLAKNLKRLQKLFPMEFDFFPRTWVLPSEMIELRNFAAQRPRKAKRVKKKDSTIPPLTPNVGTSADNNNGSSNFDVSQMQIQAVTTVPSGIQSRQFSAPGSPRTDMMCQNELKKPIQPNTATVRNQILTDEESAAASQEDNQSEMSEQEFGGEPMILSPSKRPLVLKQRLKVPLPGKAPLRWTSFPMIVKPDQGSQGKGIFLTNDLESVVREDTTSVVQQYMQNPYLLDGLKFDLRLYVLVLSCEPLKIFLYEEGLVRFATQPFKPFDKTSDKSCYNNLFMHLTNYAINKESNQFRAAKSMEDDSSHKRTLKKVLERLRAEGQDTDCIMGEIKEVIIKTLISIQQDLAHNYRACQSSDLEGLMSFELLGFDIILDNKAKPILLEVNQAPSFATDSPLDYEIKHGLFKDMFKLLGVTVEKKKMKMKRLYEEKKEREVTRLTLKQKNILRRQYVNAFKLEQEAFEAENNGRFEKIFPLPVQEAAEGNQTAQADENLSLNQKSLAQSQYQALQKQQERYDRLLCTVNNTDMEAAVRAKNRLDDHQKREERRQEIGGTKLRVKKSEKKRLDGVMAGTRNNSSTIKKALSLITTEIVPIGSNTTNAQAFIKVQGSIEDTMRKSIMNPTGSLGRIDSADKRLSAKDVRKSLCQRFNEDLGSSDGGATTNFAKTVSIKNVSQQIAHNHANKIDTRKSINLDQNLKQIVELQNKIGLSSPTILPFSKNTQASRYKNPPKAENARSQQVETSIVTSNKVPPKAQSKFNLVQFGLNQTVSQSLTGREAQTKKHIITAVVAPSNQKAPYIVDGLKPNIKQYKYNTPSSFSQSQNPINLRQNKKLKSGEYDFKSTTNSNNNTSSANNNNDKTLKQTQQQYQSNRQKGGGSNGGGNLLPDIARKMVPVDKSSAGFRSQPNSTSKNEVATTSVRKKLSNHDQTINKQQRQGYRCITESVQPSSGIQSPNIQQKSAIASNSTTKKLSQGTIKREIVSTTGSIPASGVTTSISSPKRAEALIDRYKVQQRSSMQATPQQKPLQMKTQQMSLGTLNIQPVIIDAKQLEKDLAHQLTPPKSSTPTIILDKNNGFQTQKFSKIQLQTIIDNLYHYEPKNSKMTVAAPLMSSPHNIPQKELKLKPLSVTQHQLPLPGVKTEIKQGQKQSANHVPNLVMSAIASNKAKQAALPEKDFTTPNDMSSNPNNRMASSESKRRSKGPTFLHHYTGHDRGRFTAYCNMLARQGTGQVGEETLSPQAKSGLALTGKSLANAVKTPTRSFYVVNGSSLQNKGGITAPVSRLQQADLPHQPTIGNNVINFNNCNVTIINNNYDTNFEQSFGQTIIQNHGSCQHSKTPSASLGATHFLTRDNKIRANKGGGAGIIKGTTILSRPGSNGGQDN